MRLNIRRFGHGVPCPPFTECTLETRLTKLRFQDWAVHGGGGSPLIQAASFHYEFAQAVRIALAFFGKLDRFIPAKENLLEVLIQSPGRKRQPSKHRAPNEGGNHE
jgi:hypothetical protein